MEELIGDNLNTYEIEMYFNHQERKNELQVKLRDSEIFGGMKMAVDISVRFIEMGVSNEIITEATGMSLSDINSMKS